MMFLVSYSSGFRGGMRSAAVFMFNELRKVLQALVRETKIVHRR